MTGLDRIEQDHSLLSAASRYDRLRLRDALLALGEIVSGDGGDARDD